MSVLQALDRYYHRIPDIAEPGWSSEKFGWCIILDRNGQPVDVQNLHDVNGKKPRVRLYAVPEAVRRTSGVAPNFLWDKSAYVLGVKGRAKGDKREPPWELAPREHAAFVDLHLERLADAADKGLVALVRFLRYWQPDRFAEAPFTAEMLDANFLFRLDGEQNFLHQRAAARALVEAGGDADEGGEEAQFCLINGEVAPVARLHPTI